MSDFKENKDENFEVDRSEIFNSDYYFDDIIEELNESGLYSEDDIPVEKIAPVIPENTDISEKMSGFQQDFTQRIQKIEQKVLNINEMLFNTKTEVLQTIQKMQNNLLLMKFETEEGIAKISDLFKEKVSNDSVKEKAFEELYSQLESYKRNFIFTAIKPFVHDLLLMYDRIESEMEHKEPGSDETCTKLSFFKDELLEILYRNDIIPLAKTTEGEKFNPEKSNAVDKCETDDAELDNKVKKVLKIGFMKGETVIRPELVQLYKCNSKQDS